MNKTLSAPGPLQRLAGWEAYIGRQCISLTTPGQRYSRAPRIALDGGRAREKWPAAADSLGCCGKK
jgi:hypothetical protein